MLWKEPASLFGHRRAKFWGAFQQSLCCWTIHKNTTMVRAPINPPGSSPKVPAWKERHSGVVCMLSTGIKADGRLSHELIQAVKLKYGYKSDKAVRQIWKKHKQALGCKFRRNSGRNSQIPFRFGDFASGTTEYLHYDRVLVQYSDYNNSYRNTVRA